MRASPHASKKELEEFKGKFSRSSAIISDCLAYRYRLDRVWDDRLQKVAFIMLNPSTADHNEDDPTIRRCIRFAKDWGYGGISVANLFALRATNPISLRMVAAPVGPENDIHIMSVAKECREIVCAWGAHGGLLSRDEAVSRMLTGRNTVSLKLTKDGSPGHPLYIKADAKREAFYGKGAK